MYLPQHITIMNTLLLEYLDKILNEVGTTAGVPKKTQLPGSVLKTPEGNYRAKRIRDGKILYWGDERIARAWVSGEVSDDGGASEDDAVRDSDGSEKTTRSPSQTTPQKPSQSNVPPRSSMPDGPVFRTPTGTPAKPTEVYKQLYGPRGRKDLLIASEEAQRILDTGFIAGKGAPPGNAGSNFNENMSGEASLILAQFPDIDEVSLARVLFERTKTTALGVQQKDVSLIGTRAYPAQGRFRITVPDDILTTQEKIIYKNCLIAARSGRQKYQRLLRGVRTAQTQVGFSAVVEHRVFGGAKSELQSAQDMVEQANNCFVYDEEVGMIEIPKDTLIAWIGASGGGKNAADSVQMVLDERGNLIYDGWSDKKTLADIQGNSSLRDEYTKMTDQIVDMEEGGRISDSDGIKAKALLLAAQQFSDELEDKYADTSAQLADTFLSPSFLNNAAPFIVMAKNDSLVGKGRFNAFAEKIKRAQGKSGGSVVERKLREMAALGSQRGYRGDKLTWYVLNKLAESKMLSGDERKILERVALAHIKMSTPAGGALPQQLEGLEIKSVLKKLRGDAIAFQREIVTKLNEIKIRNTHGDVVNLGDHLKALEIANILHLEKIEAPTPPADGDAAQQARYYEQALARSTHLMMEGIPVTPKTLRECLGVDTIREFEKSFEVIVASTGAKAAMSGDESDEGVEGSVVYIYSLGKGGTRRLVAKKTYRSKQGDTGKTGTTITWEKDMQNCFDSKGAK